VAVVLLPSLLATQAGGRNRFEVTAGTVEEALQTLPIADLLFDERGSLRPLVNVYVEGRDVRETGGLGTAVGETDTVRVIAAIAGG
jgi:sulfur-carrier protein